MLNKTAVHETDNTANGDKNL